jgi:VanZ family protein
VHKKFLLGTAIGWTALIGVLCLVKSSDLPSLHLSGTDKYVHFTFHFIFTLLWATYAVPNRKEHKIKKSLKVVGYSLLYGILIEVLQETLTTTRHADIFDVLANLSGALTAFLVFVMLKASVTKNT